MLKRKPNKIAALILAAGESRRLGQPKQNLAYGDSTLLNHIKKQLNANFVERTFIVLGAYANEIIKECGLSEDDYIFFKGWKEGMGSSLAYACSKIFETDDYDGILITLSDLPMVTQSDYKKMVELFKQGNGIVATKSGNVLRVPAIFGYTYFNELLALEGDKGARLLIQKHLGDVKSVLNDRATIDVDSQQDYKSLISQ